VRALCRRYETELDTGDDPWSPAGERRLARALLAPRPRTGTLLPLLAVPLWDERADLRDAYPEAPLSPGRFLGWFERHGAAEHGYLRWVELARDGRASPFERTPLELAREVWSARADLRAAYPRPAGADAERFARWTADYGRAEHALPAECAAAVAAAPAAAARVAARATRHAAERPVEETARELLARGVARGELGLDDVVAWLWSGDSGIAREPRSAG
jgi:hypothetical protein